MLDLPQLLTPQQVSEQLQISVGTLSQWRFHQRYPLTYIRVGRSIRYTQESVQEFLRARTAQTIK
jgi:predicted site-specific integrase-resolvase